MPAKYAWKVTQDYIGQGEDKDVLGPRDLDCQLLKYGTPNFFRMYDDDNELYYMGFIVGNYHGFEPLDDFGMPNAGCTRIEYLSDQGKWETL